MRQCSPAVTMQQLLPLLLLPALLHAPSALSMALTSDGGVRMTADSKQLVIPEAQARQMGQLLGSRNFSLTLQFIQAAEHSGSLVSVYSGKSLIILHLTSNVRSHRLTLRLKTTQGHVRTVDAQHEHDLSDGEWHRVVLQVEGDELQVTVDCDLVIHEQVADVDFAQLLRRQPHFLLGSTYNLTDNRLIGTLREFSVDRATLVHKHCPYLTVEPLKKHPTEPHLISGVSPDATVFEHQEPHTDGVLFTRAKSSDKITKTKPDALSPDNFFASALVNDNGEHIHRDQKHKPQPVPQNDEEPGKHEQVVSEVRYLKSKVRSLAEQFSQWKEVVKNYESQLKNVQLHQRGCQVGQMELANGDKWTNAENCTECMCILGDTICKPLGCAPLDCVQAIHVPGQCCPTCAPKRQKCIKDGEWHEDSAVFWPRDCVRCECNDGHVTCEFHDVNTCPVLDCPRDHQSTPPDECCPKCANIDFCAREPCGGNATCTNGKWRRECHCAQGFVGNGEHCFDLDECVWNEQTGTRIAHCGKEALCVNTFGSYECVCKPGYTKMLDGSCLDTLVNS